MKFYVENGLFYYYQKVMLIKLLCDLKQYFGICHMGGSQHII